MKKLTLLFLSIFSFLFYCANPAFAQIAIGEIAGSETPKNDGNFILVPDNVPKYNGPICIGCELPEPEKPKNTTPSSPTNGLGIGTIVTPPKPTNPANGLGIGSIANCLGCELPAPENPKTETPTIETPKPQIVGCTDPTATNYSELATIHEESLCKYPHKPENITGYMQTSEVEIGATSWNIEVKLSHTGTNLNYHKIQTWNQFNATNATTNDKTVTITMRQFDDQRLNIECTNYEITIPKNAITTEQGDKNNEPITGNFTVKGCKNQETTNPNTENTNTENSNTENPENASGTISTIKENQMYLSLYDTDENGKTYINLINIAYFIGFVSFFFIVFFLLFSFIKNSFIGKSKK